MIIIYKKETTLTQLIETFKTSQARQKGSNRRGARIRLKESAGLTLVGTIHAQRPSRRSGHHFFITAAAGCAGCRPGAHAQARIPRGVLSRHQSGQLSAPRLPARGGSARVRDLPFRGVREVGLGAARVCDHEQTRPPREGNADDQSSAPRAIFDPKPAYPAGWPATPTNGFQPDSPKPVLRTGVLSPCREFSQRVQRAVPTTRPRARHTAACHQRHHSAAL